MCAPLRRREPRTYAMVAHCARDGGARPPQLARVPSRCANGALMTSASGPCRAPRRPTRNLARQPRGGDSCVTADGDDGDGQGSRFWAGAQRPPHRPLETAPAGRKILAVLGRRNTDFTEKETMNCNLQLSIFSARRPLHGHARPLLTPP